MRGIAITGTDTGVGKTLVAVALLRALQREGVKAWGMKPVETGSDGSSPTDGEALLASSPGAPSKDVVPYSFAEPLAPLLCSRRARVPIELSKLDESFLRLRRSSFVVVEGAGGIAVPYGPGWTFADLVQRWELPLLVVARPYLGTINHTVLTVEYARSKGVEVLGFLTNPQGGAPPESTPLAEEMSPPTIEEMTGVPHLGRIPRLPPPPDPEEVVPLLQKSVLSRVLAEREGES